MKPAAFEYVRPASVDEAVTALDAHGGMARVLAGGQSLVPMLGMRLMRPAALVDITYDVLAPVTDPATGTTRRQIEATGSSTSASSRITSMILEAVRLGSST